MDRYQDMSDSTPRGGGSAAAADAAPAATGHWELDLWSGGAAFNGWFYRRLQWPKGTPRKRLDELKPYLPGGAWETFLQALRDLLERQIPLDLKLRAELPDGRSEYWLMQASAERNAAGQPVHIGCSTRAAGAP